MTSLFGLFKSPPQQKEKTSPRKPISLEVYSGPQCEECCETYAIRFCPVCNTNQCEGCCTNLHLPKKRKSHIELFQKCITRREETIQFIDREHEVTIHAPTSENCVLHTGEMLTKECKTCQKLICGMCEKEGHLGHEMMTSTQAIQELTRRVFIDEKAVEKQLVDIKEAKQELTDQMTKLEQMHLDTKESINEYFDALARTAELKRASLLKTLESTHAKDVDAINNLVTGYDYLVRVSGDLQKRETMIQAFDAYRYNKDIMRFIPRIPQNHQISSTYAVSFDPKLLKAITSYKFDSSEKHFVLKERVVNVDIEKSSINGDGLKIAALNKEAKFVLNLCDRDGKPARVNPENIFVNIIGKEKISAIVKVVRVGQYRVKYKPTYCGEAKISVEVGTLKVPGSPFTLQIENSNTIELKHTGDFDNNGLFSYLGGLGKKKYENPMFFGMCEVTCSSISNFSSKIFTIVDREVSNYYSAESDKEPWVQISIAESNHSFLPNYYCLRNGSGLAECALRNWKLEGSNTKNGPWYLIKQHFDDKSITAKKNSSAGWKLDPLEFYTNFKITITGPNADEESILSLGGVEFYGSLKKIAIK
jgi:hypothetical protein